MFVVMICTVGYVIKSRVFFQKTKGKQQSDKTTSFWLYN